MADQKTFTVSLFFNPQTQKFITALIEKLSRITGNDYRANYHIPPHLTIGMYRSNAQNAELLIKKAENFATTFAPFTIKIENYGTFKNKRLFLKPDKESQQILKDFNLKLHNIMMPDFPPANNDLYIPGRYFPHIALASGLTNSQLKIAKEYFTIKPVANQPLKIESMSLAQRVPYKVIF